MNIDTSITFHLFDKFLWLRCTRRGSFVNSPILKAIAEKAIDAGTRLVVVDLETCQGVDSTFMGSMAGIARRLLALGGSLQVACPSDRTRSSLESLGLDILMEIDPPAAPWRGHLEEIRAQLHGEDEPSPVLDGVEQARHVLASHETLSELSPHNAHQFRYVRESLQEEIDRRQNEEK